MNSRCLYCDVFFHGKEMLTDAGNPLPFLLVCTENTTALGRMCEGTVLLCYAQNITVLDKLTQCQHRVSKRSHTQEHHCFVSPFIIKSRIAEILHLTSHKPLLYPEGPRRLSMRNLSKQYHDAGSSQNTPFLSTFVQLGKATISFVMSVCPSA